MTTDPIVLFPLQLEWTPVNASVTATISAKTARGGYGFIGWGGLFKGVYLMGSGDAAAVVSNYGYVS